MSAAHGAVRLLSAADTAPRWRRQGGAHPDTGGCGRSRAPTKRSRWTWPRRRGLRAIAPRPWRWRYRGPITVGW